LGYEAKTFTATKIASKAFATANTSDKAFGNPYFAVRTTHQKGT
jgi:hypothetical protein